MNIKEIEQLIDCYWNGLTSTDDERRICSFFENNNNLPQEVEMWRDWFASKETLNELQLDDTFDREILSRIEQSQLPKKRIGLRYITRWAVASVAIGCFIYFSWMNSNEPMLISRQEITVEEQQEYEIVKELLCFTSYKMNQTEAVLNENLREIDVMNTYIKIK